MKLAKWINKVDYDKVIMYNQQGLSLKKMCNLHFNIPYQRFVEVVKELNIPVNRGIRTKIEHTFFDEINSEIKAYLLGYILADGSLEERSKRILLGCNIADKYIIDLFKKLICPDNLITTRKNIIKLSFRSVHMFDTLKTKYKVLPRKTYDFNYEFNWEFIPSEFHRDFIRGYVDGDGCFSGYSNKRITRFSIAGTQKNFLTDMVCKVNSEINAKLYIYNKNINYQIGFSVKKADLIPLYNYFYSKANFYLERKRSKFLINTEVNEDIKISSSP